MKPSIIFVLGCILAHPLAQAVPAPSIDSVLARALAHSGTPGAAVGVVSRGKIVLAKGYGVRRAGEGAAVDARTVFSIGSTSKAFTAAGVGMLVDDGKLKWDDRIVQHLPGFAMADPYVGANLTLRDVFTHRSGLEDTDFLVLGTDLSRAELMARMRHVTPAYAFRTKAAYQNVMLLYPGEICAAVAGTSWDSFMQARIFGPLGMADTRTSVRTVAGMPNVASPHVLLGTASTPIRPLHIENVAPSGGINSSLHDMLVWARFQLALGKHEGKQLLKPETVKEMWAAQMARSPSELRWPGSKLAAYGLGWVVSDYHGYTIVHHDGAIDGMTAKVLLVPEMELGIVVLSNLDYSAVPNVATYTLLDRYLGRPAHDWGPHFDKTIAAVKAGLAENQAAIAALRKPGASQLSAQQLAGSYQHPLLGLAVVTVEAGQPHLTLLGKKAPLEAFGPDLYRVQFDADAHTFPAYAVTAAAAGGRADILTIRIYDDHFAMRRTD